MCTFYSTKCDFCEEAVAHEFGECLPNEDAETHTKTCETCGFAKTEDCNMQLSFKNHTCTEEGWVGHQECTVCGRNKDKREITPAAHTYTNGKVESNNDGTHNKICDVCGEKEKVECTLETKFVENNEHADVCSVCNYQTNKEACKYEGYEQGENGHYQVCTVCGNETEEVEHTEKATDGTANGHKVICEVCGETLEENVPHEYKYKEGSGDNASEKHTHICDCGYTVDATRDMFGNLTTENIPHSKEENGGQKGTYSCAVCDYTYSFWMRHAGHTFNDLYYFGDLSNYKLQSNKWMLKCKTCNEDIYFDNLEEYFDVTAPTCTEYAKIKIKVTRPDVNLNSVYNTTTSVEKLITNFVDNAVLSGDEEEAQQAMAVKLGLAPTGKHTHTEWTKNKDNKYTSTCKVCKGDEIEKASDKLLEIIYDCPDDSTNENIGLTITFQKRI